MNRNKISANARRTTRQMRLLRLVSLTVISAAVFALGCQTPDNATNTEMSSILDSPPAMTLSEGDALKISFPGSPNLDTNQTIRRDGRITMAIVGEVEAAGLTPKQLEQKLVKLYAKQLVSNEINVTVVSASFSVFVSGAVAKPGKIVTDRPITALEAIMEAGGFDPLRANLKGVVVIRQDANGQRERFRLNIKAIMDGRKTEPFYLKRSDIIYVPQRLF